MFKKRTNTAKQVRKTETDELSDSEPAVNEPVRIAQPSGAQPDTFAPINLDLLESDSDESQNLAASGFEPVDLEMPSRRALATATAYKNFQNLLDRKRGQLQKALQDRPRIDALQAELKNLEHTIKLIDATKRLTGNFKELEKLVMEIVERLPEEETLVKVSILQKLAGVHPR